MTQDKEHDGDNLGTLSFTSAEHFSIYFIHPLDNELDNIISLLDFQSLAQSNFLWRNFNGKQTWKIHTYQEVMH